MRPFDQSDPGAGENVAALLPIAVGDYLWRPLKLKILWLCSFGYWGGVLAADAKPNILSFFHTVVGGYIAIFLCPPLVFMALVGLFLRAWFAQLDISDWESVPEHDFYQQLHQSRVRSSQSGGLLDPTLDPLNPQSGIIHRRHMGWED